MLPPNLKSPNEVKRYYDSVYLSMVDSGQYTPFLYPWAACGAAIVLIYLFIDHRRSPTLKSLRYPVFGLLLAFESWSLLNNKARTAAAAYGVGLVSSWGTLWVATIMIFNDCQTDFKRIERTDQKALDKVKTKSNGVAPNGTASGPQEGQHSKDVELLHASERLATQGPSQRTGPVIWQSYPSGPWIERLDWVTDLFCSFRGIGWNFETNGIPALPAQVESELKNGKPVAKVQPPPPPTVSRTGIHRFSDRAQLLAYTLPRLVVGYLVIDLLHVLMHHDPHFWGYINSPNPPSYLPSTVRQSPALLQAYRLCLCCSTIYAVLTQIFRLGPVFFAGVLGPRVLGLRGEAWMNPPDFWGGWHTVLDKGLAGWWGGFWHQEFRYAFEVPGLRLLAAWRIDARSNGGRAIATFVAFFLSGALHACGSASQLGHTRPLRGPMCFFLLQAVGIIGQTAVAGWLKGAGLTGRMPRWVRQGTNFAFTITWMYLTAPLLMDDFARGGVWLYEPIPISPLRALGFGAKDDGWYDLWFDLISWRGGKTWWDTGIAF